LRATATQPRERTPDPADLGGYQPPENRAGAAYLLRKLLDVSPSASPPPNPNATGDDDDAASGGFAPSDDSSFVRGATAFLYSVTAGVFASPPPLAEAEGGGGADVATPAAPRSTAGSVRSRASSRLPFRRRNDGGTAAEDGESGAAGAERAEAAEAKAKAVQMGDMGRDDVSENAHICSLSETAKVAPHMPVLPPRRAKRVIDPRRQPAGSNTLSRPSTSAAWVR